MTDALTTRQLNRTVLARQRLLEPSTSPLPRVLEEMGGLQAQYAPSMYIGLWSRMAGFERDELTAALHDRTVVQGTLLRATIHLVSREDWWPFAIAVRERRFDWWLRVQRPRPSDAEVEAARGAVSGLLALDSFTDRDVKAAMAPSLRSGLHVLADVVRVPPSGTWERRRANVYADARRWVGPEPALDRRDAVRHLVARYLGAFGPATAKDVATWAGLPVTDIVTAAEGMAIVRHRGADGATLLDLAEHRVADPDDDRPLPVRFLPVWDALLLAHARRTAVLAEEHRAVIFTTKNPQSVNTFLVGGAVAGTWWFDGTGVAIDPLRPLTAAERRSVGAEAHRITRLFGP